MLLHDRLPRARAMIRYVPGIRFCGIHIGGPPIVLLQRLRLEVLGPANKNFQNLSSDFSYQ